MATIFTLYAAHRVQARAINFRPLPLERFVQLAKRWSLV